VSAELWGRFRDAVVELLYRLPPPPDEEGESAAASLGRGHRIEALGAALRSGDGRAARRLGESGDPRAVEPLIAVLGGELNGPAATALGRLGDGRAVEPLIAVLVDRSQRGRGSVATALGRLGDRQAVDALVTALGDRGTEVRRSAAAALDSLGWQPADDGQRAAKAIADRDWARVVTLGTAAVDPLLELVRAGSDVDHAAPALAEIGDGRAVPVLDGRLVRSHHPEVDRILPALARLDPAGMPERWVAALSPPRARSIAVESLAIEGLRRTRSCWSDATVESLLSVLRGGRPIAATAAARVLEGDPSPRIVEALDTYREKLRVRHAELAGSSIGRLIAELVVIGQGPGYLRCEGDLTEFEAGHQVRAVEIGQELNRRGSLDLMRRAHEQVTVSAGRTPARELEAIWDGIGEWMR
jgi:hypothetical protein